MRSMVTGDHDFEAELTREAREQAEQDERVQRDAPGFIMIETVKPEICEFGWYDMKQGHICRQPKGHPPPHRCTLNTTCQAKFTE